MPETTERGWAVALKSTGADTLELGIYDVIGASFFSDGITAKDVLAKLRSAPKASTISLRVNSIGGIVDEAKAMVNLLGERASNGVTIEATVDGLAASAASYLLTAASKVFMPANAFMMLHGVRGGVRGDAKDLENAAALYRRTNEQLASAYAAASQRRGVDKSKEDYLAAFAKGDLYLDATEAIEWGLADEKLEALSVAACLVEIDQLSGAPEALRAAPYATRAESSRVVDVTPPLPPKAPAKPDQDASAVIGGAAKEKPMTMTKDELQKQHPELYAAVFAEGEAKERKRVLAHIKMGERVAAMKVATKAIADGAAFADDEVQAEYMSAMADRRDVQNRQADSDTAGAAVENAKTPKSNAAAGGAPNLIEAAADIYCGKEA